VSNVTGTHTSTPPFFNTQSLYVDWAVVNDGDAAISGTTFYYYLYVDGVVKGNWNASSMPCCGYFHYINDFNIGVLATGTHTIMIRADATNTIAENNETDNTYTRTITVSPYLNLAPYQPAGWDSPLVISKVTGTTTSVTTFFTTENIYVDWSVANYGSYATAHDFYVCLYIDGVHTAHWYQGLGAGSIKSQLDYLVGKLSAGTHTIHFRAR
jgi:subtilase family serine protease